MKTITHTPNPFGVLFFKDATDPQTSGPRIGTDDGISNRGMNVLLIIFMMLTVGLAVASATETDDVKMRILLRQSMLDVEQQRYDEAVPKLMELLAKDSENANAAYLLGMCHLYGTRNFHQAAFYLDRASAAASRSYVAWDLDERNAPVHAHYLLATAWEQAGDDDRAAMAYEQYIAAVTGDDAKKVSPRIMNMVRFNIASARLRSNEVIVQTAAAKR
jgi:tetratricopeptide (TPR) repeat protein